jgi:prophage antirepressor-like protein
MVNIFRLKYPCFSKILSYTVKCVMYMGINRALRRVERMDDKNIKLFENRRIRTVWDEEKEEWYFSVVDVVSVLTDSLNPNNYWKVLKNRLNKEGNQTVTVCNQLKMLAEDGKMRLTDVVDTKGVLRIIQSVPSPKAEPFKVWLAKVGAERIDETIDPEIAIDRAFATYLRKGYTKEWINQRILTLQVRNELTSEWDVRGVKEGREYALLTDEISRVWSSMTTRQYKTFKGLKKENLRDNMSLLELTLNQLAEVTTTAISKKEKPTTFEENRQVAKRGGSVAGVARQAAEAQTGEPAITSKKAVDFARLLTDVIDVKDDSKKKSTDTQ